MKILFITDDWIIEPLGIGYLSSCLKQNGHGTDLMKYKNIDDIVDIVDYIRDNKFDILGYSVSTGKHQKFLELNEVIKKICPKIISIFGGAHSTYYPEMKNEKGVDYIVRGEAEKTFVNLIKSISSGNKIKKEIPCGTLEQNLDEIPFPDRKLLYKYPENRNNPIKNVMTTRGCCFKCPYCFNSLYRELYKGQNWVRHRSPENVIEECIELKKYPLEIIYFQDDEFLQNPNLFKLLELYKEKVKVAFHCQLRVEFLTEEKAKRLKDAGCIGVTFSVESGNEYIRRELLGRKFTKEKVLNCCDILKRNGLKFRIEHMCGLPGENLTQVFETLDFCLECKPTMGWIGIFQPYPNLPLGEYAKKYKLWNGKIDEIKETFFEDSVLNITFKNQLKNFQRLFGLVVCHPWLRKILWWLIKVPNNVVYNKLFVWSKKQDFRRLYAYS